MPLPDYQISVISVITGRVVSVLGSTTYYSMHYSRKINDIGAFVAVFPYTEDYETIFAWDNFVEVRRTSPITGLMLLEETYLVRSRHHYVEGNDERLVVGGLSLAHLLARRIIDPDDDPAATDGYSVKAGAADMVMHDYVREQAGDLASAGRPFPGMTLQPVLGAGVTINTSVRYDNLFNVMQEIASASGMDFRLERASDYFINVIIEPIGTDRTRTSNQPLTLPWLGLSPQRGNLQDPSLKEDRTDEKNFVYVLGQGQGEERLVLKEGTTDITLTPFNRIEFAKDQRNVDKLDTAGLQTSATTQLNDNKAVNDFTFKPVADQGGSVYRKDWELGDKVTVIWNESLQDLRITGVEVETDSSGELVEVGVETIIYG